MDFDKIAKEITDKIEKFKNKEKLNWKEVFDRELDSIKNLKKEDRDLVLIRIVREISKRGYTIEDNPFKLSKY